MTAPGEAPVVLQRIGGRGSGPRGWAAAVAVLGVMAGIVAAGSLGGSPSSEPPAPSGRSTATSGAATRASASPRSTAAATAGTPTTARRVTPGHAGYSVAYPRDGSHRPIIFDDGALAIFGFGERVPDGAYPGSIRVAVGTPGLGAAVSGRSGVRYVFGANVGELQRAYLHGETHVPVARSGWSLGAGAAIILDFQGETTPDEQWSVALIAHGGRSYVITSTGFAELYPRDASPARSGLLAFLAGFEFTTPLFASRELGFEVPFPVAAEPVLDPPGAVVFADGEETSAGAWTHAISVSTGTRAEPAIAEVLAAPAGGPLNRIWAASLVQLQSAYVEAVGGGTGSSTTIELDGELAVLVERPRGLAATVLAVHGGRVFVISTTGSVLREPSPGFAAFLETFRFLEADGS